VVVEDGVGDRDAAGAVRDGAAEGEGVRVWGRGGNVGVMKYVPWGS